MPDKVLSGADGVMKALEGIARRMGGGEVSVGFMAGATYPDGTPVAAVAFWNEFGTSRVPPRPFFRTMIAKESPQWAKTMARMAKNSNYDGLRVLALMGEDIGGALVDSIGDVTSPPLAKSTILARAKNVKRGDPVAPTIAKPLIDTAHMLKSVSYQVNEGTVVPIIKE